MFPRMLPRFVRFHTRNGTDRSAMSNDAQVCITGASGFIGSAVLRKLLEAGFTIRALVRPASPRQDIAGLRVEFIQGDVRDRGSVRKAIAGCRYVMHLAADYRLWARHRGEVFATNLDGTRNVMEEAIN